MAVVWSFNTTVRNPERMQNFLRALKELEGKKFNEECQKTFFALQIKKRLYKPTARTLGRQDLIGEVYKKTAEEIPDKIVSRIIKLYSQKSGDPAFRGRTTAGILNRFGLCIASKSRGQVKITDLGNKWLENEVDDQELFFKFLLKWQYPNPLEQGYSDFNIKPFIGTLTLIYKVNEKWAEKGYEPIGISRKEFMLFVPSLKDYRDINKHAQKIVAYRLALKRKSGRARKEYENSFFYKRTGEIFGDNKDLPKAQRDLKDYTDSAIRYFRMSGFIYLRGNNTHVDTSPDYKIEIQKLIDSDNASKRDFANLEEYLDYLTNSSIPSLPWENERDLEQIKHELIAICRALSKTVSKGSEFEVFLKSLANLALAHQVERLKEYKNSLQIEKLKVLKYDKEKLKEFIAGISNTLSEKTQTITTRPSLDLEWFVSLSLMVLNDARDITPSYKLGDDGLPTGFSSNIADIECLYDTFGMIVEVTLLMGRDQWFAEGQPVMRHLRDFENKYGSYKDRTYCLFIAPYLHRDTLNTFWSAIKGVGYEGRKQKIIPIRVDQYVKVLTRIGKLLHRKTRLNHQKYKELLEMLYSKCAATSDAYQWTSTFDAVIEHWSDTLSANEN